MAPEEVVALEDQLDQEVDLFKEESYMVNMDHLERPALLVLRDHRDRRDPQESQKHSQHSLNASLVLKAAFIPDQVQLQWVFNHRIDPTNLQTLTWLLLFLSIQSSLSLTRLLCPTFPSQAHVLVIIWNLRTIVQMCHRPGHPHLSRGINST